MINIRIVKQLSGLVGVVLFLYACGVPGDAPDGDRSATRIAERVHEEETRVAEEQAVAATLTVRAPTLPPVEPTPSPTMDEVQAPLSTDAPTATSEIEAASVPPPTVTPGAPICQVVSQSLNIRSGPGVIYNPPLTAVPRNTELIPTAFNGVGIPGGQWLQVQLPASGQSGWVSADPQFVACNVDFGSLPFVAAPPTPTPTNTPVTAPPPPTPTEIPFFVLVPPGGGNDQIDGQVLFPGYGPGDLDPNNLVFRNRLAFRVLTYDVGTGSTTDGAGIDRVRIRISSSEDGEVHNNQENSRAFCAFGGDEPACQPWVFAEHGYTWPDGKQIKNINYDVSIEIIPKQGDKANWNFSFSIEGAPSELNAEIVQIGPNSTDTFVGQALVFQVAASNPSAGTSDGAGIKNVDLRIIRNGNVVYDRTEQNAGYCAFGGGEPNCNIWIFADHNNEWPNGKKIESGGHILRATVNAQNGQKKTVEMTIEIQP